MRLEWLPQGSPASLPGFRVGHAVREDAPTGCSVVLCPPQTVGGVEARGSATGTRGMDGLLPGHMVDQVHAVVFTGGSSFGLAACQGVQDHLEAQGVGLAAGPFRVPVVAGAVIFDLPLSLGRGRPDAALGRAACLAASDGPMPRGNVGAGAGATVGKLYGPAQAMKGGLGGAGLRLGELYVAALAVVNAFGDVLGPDGAILAGARRAPDSLELVDTAAWFMAGNRRTSFRPPSNTTLGLVATNARLDKLAACKLAALAHHGLVRCIRPVHSVFDGDLVVTLASGQVEADLTGLGLLAAEALRRAVLDAVWSAQGLPGLPAASDLTPDRKPHRNPLL